MIQTKNLIMSNSMNLPGFEDFQEDWNQDVIEPIETTSLEGLVVYSRDWTVDTIFSQISQTNIDLNPKFQRRNAWNDEARSRLIESLIVGIPVPEIVFAEDQNRKKAFIVIDGKQRLLTLAGFFDPEKYNYWKSPKLQGLKIRPELNGLTYKDLDTNPDYIDAKRQLSNADMRCTVISNYSSDDVLYDVFHRLNTSAVPLSTQELRQALIKGEFGAFLMELTDSHQPIHEILGLNGPDPRLRDSELVLRSIAFSLFGDAYSGNLKRFLDDAMLRLTKDWPSNRSAIEREYADLNKALQKIQQLLSPRRIGRKITNGEWEWRFNKAVFEVEVYFFRHLDPQIDVSKFANKFTAEFTKLCEDQDFRDSIESTTKTITQYRTRYTKFESLMHAVFGVHLELPTFLK